MAWFPCSKSGGGIKKGGILNVQAPAPGQSGYINFARIKVLDNYANHTCCFTIQNRGIYFPVMLSIGFQNINHTDPGLISFLYWGASDYGIYAVRNTISTWDLYVRKKEPHDAVEILNLNYDAAHFEITFPNSYVEEKGEGWMSPQPGGRVAGASHVYDSENDGGITFSYAKPGLRRSEFTWLAAWNGYEMRAIHNNIFTYLKKAEDVYGMCIPYEDGAGSNDQAWIRTTFNGIIPYSPGDKGTGGHSSLGSETWWFKNAYINTVSCSRLISSTIDNPYLYGQFYSDGNVNCQLRAFFSNQFLRIQHQPTSYGLEMGVSITTTLTIRPLNNNQGQIGSSDRKWNQIYATNGSISTSDRNEKKEISYIGQESQYGDTAMSDTQLVEFILGLLPCIFKRKDGESGRPHHGIISQDFEELMKKIGIKDHAAFIKSPKTEEIEITNEDGSKGIKVQEIPGEYVYGIRYEELEGDIIRFCQILYQKNQGQQEKIENLEKRLTELENIVKKGA